MRRAGAVGLAILVATVLGACTEDGGPTVASAGGTPTASPAAGDPAAQELQFVNCMRQAGIADMPDPVPGDTSGRSAVKYALDVMGKGSDDAFQAALDGCMELLPAAPPIEPPTAEELDGYVQFAQCMRDNGVPEFPDSDPNGGRSFVFIRPGDLSGTPPVERVTNIDGVVALNLEDPLIKAAFEGCHDKLPVPPNAPARSTS